MQTTKARNRTLAPQRVLPDPGASLSTCANAPFDRFEPELGHGRIGLCRTLTSYWRFLLAALAKQGQTGAIVPSQRFLIDQMLAPVPRNYRGQILELGAGTGALTLRLAAKCPGARILACEINPALAQDIQSKILAAGLAQRVQVISGSAQRLLAAIARGQSTRPDFIFSGIPLGNQARDRVMTLIDSISHALAEGGMYIQFQYSLLDRKTIKAKFATLRTVPAFLNFPPAFVYYAVKAQA
jgi:phosphatidylethanolamine/phosphatidyl-N-methylethanolamine N-methyltransferase